MLLSKSKTSGLTSRIQYVTFLYPYRMGVSKATMPGVQKRRDNEGEESSWREVGLRTLYRRGGVAHAAITPDVSPTCSRMAAGYLSSQSRRRWVQSLNPAQNTRPASVSGRLANGRNVIRPQSLSGFRVRNQGVSLPIVRATPCRNGRPGRLRFGLGNSGMLATQT